MFYRKCPDCGANLDPDERCDCADKKNEAAPLARNKPHIKPSDASSLAKNFRRVKAVEACG